jgi:predicted ATPase
LHEYLRVGKSHKTAKDGYFLRAESFYNVASYVDDMAWYLESYGGKPLHQQSHGESFISLLNHKFKGNGIYILNEPEAALSPTRQLSALAIIHELIKKGSQFIIATHSPILMAYPDATIYSLSDNAIEEISRYV